MVIYNFLIIGHLGESIKYSDYIWISTESEMKKCILSSTSHFLVRKLVISPR
jgi:hypothetical protein